MADPVILVSIDGGLTFQATKDKVIVQHLNVKNSTDEVDPMLQFEHTTKDVTLHVATKVGAVIGTDKQDLDFIFCENIREK